MFQADICLFNFDNRNTLEQCVKSGHKTNMNGVNYFSDTNEKFLSDIKKNTFYFCGSRQMFAFFQMVKSLWTSCTNIMKPSIY